MKDVSFKYLAIINVSKHGNDKRISSKTFWKGMVKQYCQKFTWLEIRWVAINSPLTPVTKHYTVQVGWTHRQRKPNVSRSEKHLISILIECFQLYNWAQMPQSPTTWQQKIREIIFASFLYINWILYFCNSTIFTKTILLFWKVFKNLSERQAEEEKGGRERGERREEGRENAPIHWFTPKCPPQPGPGWADTRSRNLNSGLSLRSKNPITWAMIFTAFQGLHWQRAGIRRLKPRYSNVGCGNLATLNSHSNNTAIFQRKVKLWTSHIWLKATVFLIHSHFYSPWLTIHLLTSRA